MMRLVASWRCFTTKLAVSHKHVVPPLSAHCVVMEMSLHVVVCVCACVRTVQRLIFLFVFAYGQVFLGNES